MTERIPERSELREDSILFNPGKYQWFKLVVNTASDKTTNQTMKQSDVDSISRGIKMLGQQLFVKESSGGSYSIYEEMHSDNPTYIVHPKEQVTEG